MFAASGRVHRLSFPPPTSNTSVSTAQHKSQSTASGPASFGSGSWELANVLEHNVGYGFAEFAPGLFGFGSDGAGQLYAFDLRNPERVTVGDVPAIPLDVNEFRVIADSFDLFAESLSRGTV